MNTPPSLIELCKKAIVAIVQQDAEKRKALLTLPLDLLGSILTSFTPIVLQLVHDEMDCNNNASSHEAPEEELPLGNAGSKRSYAQMLQNSPHTHLTCFNDAWKHKFNERWPLGVKSRYCGVLSTSEMELLNISEDEELVDWRQRYWETHLQECLNEVAAQALSPYFKGLLGDVSLSGNMLEKVGVACCIDDDLMLTPTDPSIYKLKYNTWHFGKHARYLRLRGVLCTEELSNLLSHAKLQHVAFYHVATTAQVEGLCTFLRQNRESIQAVEIQHCRFSQMGISHICKCLAGNGAHGHQLHHLFVLSSSTLFQVGEIPSEFIYFLHTGRYLRSLVLIDNQLGVLSASELFMVLFKDMPVDLCLLHVNENELEGILLRRPSTAVPFLHSQNVGQKTAYLPLRALNLRSNKLSCLDIREFVPCFQLMPFLEHIDLSDNPIGDDGLREILPSLQMLPVSELSISMCNISLNGACSLMESLSSLKRPLHNLKLAHNPLGRSIATPLAKFLTHGVVERLDIGDIGLGLSGCSDLLEALAEIPNLTHLIISKNRLGSAGAALLCKLIASSSTLEVIDSSSNLLDSLCVKSVALQLQLESKGHGGLLQLLDLRHNPAFGVSEIFENMKGKKPTVLFSDFTANNPLFAIHDDDP